MIVRALLSLRPGAQWSLNGDTLDGLVWVDKVQSRPTDEEIEAEAEVQRQKASNPAWSVSKLTIINRLSAAGKFEVALTALRADALLYEKWLAVSALRSDDVNARALFTAVGADADAMLAPKA